MKKRAITIVVLLAAASAAWAQASVESNLASLADRASRFLAQVRITVNTGQESRRLVGEAICIDPSGVFLTLAMDPQFDKVESVEIAPAGTSEKTYPAEFLGMDVPSGLAFVKATGGSWEAISFVPSVTVKPGQPVYSAGLVGGEGIRPVGVAMARVSAVLNIPEPLVFVTGGTLMGIGAPVLTEDGKAIGLVDRQLYLNYRAMVSGRAATMPLQSLQSASFFTPVDDFAYVLTNIPTGGAIRMIPWLGIGKMDAVTPATAGLLGLTGPGIVIDQVFPGHPADKAGLHNRDVIVELDGRALEDFGNPAFTVKAFIDRIARKKEGDTADLTVLRDGQSQHLKVVLGTTPDLPSTANRYQSMRLGLAVREKVALDRFLDTTSAADQPGLIVLAVAPSGPAEAATLQADDVITKVNGQDVTTAKSVKEIVEDALVKDANATVNLVVRRGNQTLDIRIHPRAE
jgi:serine protease Do